MNKYSMAAVAMVLAAGCASNQITGMRFVTCDDEPRCEELAKQECKTDNYRVHKKFDRKRKRADYVGAATVGDVAGGFGGGGGRRLDDKEPERWKWEVDCNPPKKPGKVVETETIQYIPVEMTPEQRAEQERRKRINMRAVCEVKYADVREQELEELRREYGDPSLSCSATQ